MRRLWLFFVLAVTLLSAAGWAQRKVQEFKEPEDDSASKAFQKSRMRSFQENTANAIKAEEPFPWKMLGLASLVLVVGAIVGWRFYRETADEMSAQRVAAQSSRGSGSKPKVSRSSKKAEEEEEDDDEDDEEEEDDEGSPSDTSDA